MFGDSPVSPRAPRAALPTGLDAPGPGGYTPPQMGQSDKKRGRTLVKGQYDVARIPPRMLRGDLTPHEFQLGGVTYRLEKHLKADFFAATEIGRAHV